jgi:hypothetical protein
MTTESAISLSPGPHTLTADAPSDVQHPRLRRLYEYWLARCAGRRFPARKDIDPLEFPYILGDVMLVDVLRHPLRFRVRLHGTNMVMRAGYDMTGKTLDQLPGPEYREHVLARCQRLLDAGAPLATVHDRVLDDRLWRYEVVWLPFSDDGVEINMLLCALIYSDVARPVEPAAGVG